MHVSGDEVMVDFDVLASGENGLSNIAISTFCILCIRPPNLLLRPLPVGQLFQFFTSDYTIVLEWYNFNPKLGENLS